MLIHYLMSRAEKLEERTDLGLGPSGGDARQLMFKIQRMLCTSVYVMFTPDAQTIPSVFSSPYANCILYVCR